MARTLILLTASLLLGGTLFAQPVETPLRTNLILTGPADHARSLDRIVINVYVPVNGDARFCASSSLLGEILDSVHFEACSGLEVGAFEVQDTCVTFQNNGVLGQDAICLSACDTNDACLDFELRFIAAGYVDLPFVDDFAYDGPYPRTDIWLDRNIFVNYTLSRDPLTVGVATFDGLDETGTPYPGGIGFSDELTSGFMDLSDGRERYLSFYSQPKGFGIKPRTEDSLTVDFRSADGQWIRVWQHEGLSKDVATSAPSPDFAYQRLTIDSAFRHDAFQFRFRNRSKNEGLQELWHVDYVRLGSDEETSEPFRDIAFTYPPRSVLSPYSHMPSSHFEPGEVRTNVISSVNNIDQVVLTMNDPTIRVFYGQQELMARTFIEPVQNWTLRPGRVSYDFQLNDGGSMNYERLQDALTAIVQPQGRYEIITTLDFRREDEIIKADQNNIVTGITHFDNYFAYDDGSAESAIIDNGVGDQRTTLALEFHTNMDDQLQGLQIHIPHIEGDISTQHFNLKVWIDSLDDEPEFVQELVKPYYADAFFDTLQGFTTYDLRDSADQKTSFRIPKGRFFIGWEQVRLNSLKIPVGYDINSPDAARFLFFNAGLGWINVGESGLLRPGALMIRPIMGNEPVISTPLRDFEEQEMVVYPVPSRGTIFIEHGLDRTAGWEVEVFSMQGQRLYTGPLAERLDLADLAPGTYLMKVLHAGLRKQALNKIVISR